MADQTPPKPPSSVEELIKSIIEQDAKLFNEGLDTLRKNAAAMHSIIGTGTVEIDAGLCPAEPPAAQETEEEDTSDEEEATG